MISVEMLAKGSDPSRAKWRFSYPEAMSRKTKDALYMAIRQSWTSRLPSWVAWSGPLAWISFSAAGLAARYEKSWNR